MTARFPLLLTLLFVAVAVDAGQAEICYSSPVAFASATPPSNATVFVCPVSGSKTLPELAALGWDAVQLTPVSCGSTGGAGNTHITQQLVIQKK